MRTAAHRHGTLLEALTGRTALLVECEAARRVAGAELIEARQCIVEGAAELVTAREQMTARSGRLETLSAELQARTDELVRSRQELVENRQLLIERTALLEQRSVEMIGSANELLRIGQSRDTLAEILIRAETDLIDRTSELVAVRSCLAERTGRLENALAELSLRLQDRQHPFQFALRASYRYIVDRLKRTGGI